jgi:signal transduction histidine kinase
LIYSVEWSGGISRQTKSAGAQEGTMNPAGVRGHTESAANPEARDTVLALAEYQQRIAEPQRQAAREELLSERQRAERQNARLADALRRLAAGYAERGEELRRLRDLDAMRNAFLRNVNHECRSPLNSIFGLTTLLLRRAAGELTSEQEQLVQLIREAADALLGLVDDLADPGKLDGSQTEVHPAEIDAARLLRTLQGMLPAPLVNPDLRLIFEPPAGMPCLYSDERKVGQILRNLINNALKFTAHGEVRVSASYVPTSNAVVFSVRDTGAGIAPADQKRLLEASSPADKFLSPGQGSGLGLPLCHRLAALNFVGRLKIYPASTTR